MNMKYFQNILLALGGLMITTLACASMSSQLVNDKAEAHALELISSHQRVRDDSTPETTPQISTPADLSSHGVTSNLVDLPGDIAFAEYHDGYWTYDVRSIDNDKLTQLTSNTKETSPGGWFDYGFAWSPDGEKIAFVSNRNGNDEIYVINSDGTEEVRLTNNPLGDSHPVWSRDGKQLLFVSWNGSVAGISKVNLDGMEQVRLSDSSNSDYDPVWAPNGETIAFVSNRDGEPEIYIMNADGANPIRLTHGSKYGNSLAWSLVGDKLMFAAIDTDSVQIFMMNVDGSGLTRLTNRTSSADNEENRPAWSPDGKRIAFVNLNSICVVDASGFGKVFNFNTPDAIGSVSWSPDSKYIAFSSWNGIYLVNTESLEIILLVDNPHATSPVWAPN